MKKQRQKNALERLKVQLSDGTKPEKLEGKTTGKRIPLTDKDKERINREIKTLEGKNL